MADLGHAIQVVNVTESHTYVLMEQALQQILYAEEIKDLPVVVVSVAGAFRGGKSFLLNFFIRYLSSSASAQQDGSWLGEDSEPLAGFQWRSGIKRTTLGILMWSKPFVTTLQSGEKVAILLIDTQGTFDNKSTIRDCSTIFAMSTLLSSVQIFNLFNNIQEDDLQILQLFTEFGKLVENQGAKAFQTLEFLVRDWQFPYEYGYGSQGGDLFLREKLKINPQMPQELQDVRQHLRSSFETVSCFLMPHPGFRVLKKSYNGRIADISIEFRTKLIELVNSLFSSDKLIPKTINGERVKARDFYNYFKIYMDLYSSNTIPTPHSILQATSEANLLSNLTEARELYEMEMNTDCGPKQPSMPLSDLRHLHDQYLAQACAAFKLKKSIAAQEDVDKHLEILKEELTKRLPQYLQMNLAKTQIAVAHANEKYNEILNDLKKDEKLCVHPDDLNNVHGIAMRAALKEFDANRKRLTNEIDDDRTALSDAFVKQFSKLQTVNKQANELLVQELRMAFWNTMFQKTSNENAITDSQLQTIYLNSLTETMRHFKSQRTSSSYHVSDLYEEQLMTKMREIYYNIKSTNEDKRKEERRRRREKEEEERRRYEQEVRWEREREEERHRRERERWEREERERRENESKCTIT